MVFLNQFKMFSLASRNSHEPNNRMQSDAAKPRRRCEALDFDEKTVLIIVLEFEGQYTEFVQV